MGINNLTPKQQAFVNHYLICLNATESARRAGYQGSYSALGVTGHENLKNPKIRAELDRRFAEQKMSSDEVLARLTSHARASLEDFIGKDGVLNLKKAKSAGKLNLIKKYKITERFGKEDQVTRTVEIELHDPQSALIQLGRYHKLFTDKVEMGLPSELVEMLSKHGVKASDLFQAMIAELSNASDK